MNPGDYLSHAFALASLRQQKLSNAWIRASYSVGMVNSHLCMSVQRMGDLDILLRCMEEDFRQEEAPDDFGIRRFSLHTTMSDWWIGGMYEIARTLKERRLMSSPEFLALAEDFRLIRIPLEKYEIPNDNKLTEPLALRSVPVGKEDRLYYYDKDDSLRHHNIPRGISVRGSAMWFAISIAPVANERWIERRDLSDRFLACWPNADA